MHIPNDIVRFDPHLLPEWKSVSFVLLFRGCQLEVTLRHKPAQSEFSLTGGSGIWIQLGEGKKGITSGRRTEVAGMNVQDKPAVSQRGKDSGKDEPTLSQGDEGSTERLVLVPLDGSEAAKIAVPAARNVASSAPDIEVALFNIAEHNLASEQEVRRRVGLSEADTAGYRA